MTYDEALAYIQNDKWRASKLGLERTQALLEFLGNPERKLKFVHVAGTNGKGSTSACIASVLMKAGYRTGLYTSPYILRFNERIQVDGEHIPDDELVKLTEKIRPFADTMEDTPTEFEVITAMAMEYFLEKKCDVVVLEVGLGGEFDSTNVISTPDAAAITAIGLDHTAYLGNTLAEIAAVKAGIIKKGGSVAVYGGDPDVEKVFADKCAEVGAKMIKADFSAINVHSIDLDACRFDYGEYKGIELPLVGTYQPKNAAVAIETLKILQKKGYNITDGDIIEGLNSVYWPGRFEVLRRDPVFILDGAHNPHGIEATANSLKEHFPEGGLVFVLGIMADKDVSGMLSFIAPMARAFITVEPPNPRAMKPEELAELLSVYNKPVTPYPSIQDGVRAAAELAGKDGTVVALGSLYFSGEIRQAVKDLGD